MKPIFYLSKINFLVLLLCGIFYSSCNNDLIPDQLTEIDNIVLLASKEGIIEIRGASDCYFAGMGYYKLEAIAPMGYIIKEGSCSWSVGRMDAHEIQNKYSTLVSIAFNGVGYADIMVTCTLVSGDSEKKEELHSAILNVKVITPYPSLYIEKYVQPTSGNNFIASATYFPSVSNVTYEWSIPETISYSYKNSDRSQVNIVYPENGEYRIGVRAKDGDQYSNWVYETVKVSGVQKLVPLHYVLSNLSKSGYAQIEIILFHNDYPESPETYHTYTTHILGMGEFYTMDEYIMLIPGRYTLMLRYKMDYSSGWESYNKYEINIDEGGRIEASISLKHKWGVIEYSDLNGKSYLLLYENYW